MAGTNESHKRKLRVGLMIDSLVQPRWRYEIIKEIQSSSIADIALIIQNRVPHGPKLSLPQKISQKRKTLLYDLYTRIDDFVFRVEPDAFKNLQIEDLLNGCPVIEVTPEMRKYSDYFVDADVDRILKYDLDVVLRFGFRILKGRALQIARHGVWSYHHGDNRVNRGGPPGFWEVMNNEPTTGSVLQVLTEELDNGNVIYRSWAPTLDILSVKRNSSNYYWKSADFVMRSLRQLYAGNASLNGHEEHAAFTPYSSRLYKVPTNLQMLPLLFRLIGRFVRVLIRKLWSFEQWFLAYRFKSNPNDTNNAFYKFKRIVPPKDRFWADPFPLKFGGHYYIFVEEYIYKKGKAHISVIKIDDSGRPTESVKVLEKDHHLSYPFVFQWQDNYYMVPESGEQKKVELYRCTEFPTRWEFEKVLLENHNPVDATLIEIDGLWWMFVSISVRGIPRNWDELHLFYADSPLGCWTPHRANPVKSDVRSSRPAGRLFWWNNELYRPAQDCSRYYGYGMSLNKIVRITPSEFLEQQVATITPDWDKHIIGTHTFNTCDDISVIDCLMRRRKMF